MALLATIELGACGKNFASVELVYVPYYVCKYNKYRIDLCTLLYELL